MSKNYFYATLGEELSLLKKAVDVKSVSEIENLSHLCRDRHFSLSLRLLREFVTPVNREDLYRISALICSCVSSLKSAISLSDAERNVLRNAVSLLQGESFRFDETTLRRRQELDLLWDQISGSPSFTVCRLALESLAEGYVVTALKNA